MIGPNGRMGVRAKLEDAPWCGGPPAGRDGGRPAAAVGSLASTGRERWPTDRLSRQVLRTWPSRMLDVMQNLRIALAQIAPRLGALDDNLATHHRLLDEARQGGADLVVFPELGLTGYLLQDLAAEVAMRLDDPRLGRFAAATRGLSAIASFVEESADHRLFIAAALFEDGALRHVHRKVFLPTYGLFDERRFFAPGDTLRAVPSRLGVGLGIAICEDFWHLSVPQLLAVDGAQILINVSSSPGRDLAATNEVGLGTAASWRTLMRTYAQLTTSYVVFCNRIGLDESISFWGGSEVISPSGEAVLSAPMYDEGLFSVDIRTSDIRRERIVLPLLRDERLELQRRELDRIIAERAGLTADSTAAPGSEPGYDLAPADPSADRIGSRPEVGGGRRS
jgi:predicted amidohydrolase